MSQPRRTLLAAALCLSVALPLFAQAPAADLSGHWEGSIQAPAIEVPFALDVVKGGAGEFAGTVNLPADRLTGLPLLRVALEGTTVSFYARADQPLTGTLSADGTTVTGDYFAEGGSAPFSMMRKGAAQVYPAPSSGPIGRDLEGTWDGIIAANGLEVHVRLSLVNRPDHRSTGYLVNMDQGGLRLPLAIAQDGSSVTLTTPVTTIVFTGTVDAGAGEFRGVLSHGSASVPLTFHRIAGDAK